MSKKDKAFKGVKTRTAMADLAVSNIEEFFKTGKCRNKVN